MSEIKQQRIYDMGAAPLTENINRRMSEFTRENMYIGLPAKIVGVDDYETLQCVDVEFVINDVHTKLNMELMKRTILKKVFVKLQGGGGFQEKIPVSKGDLVLLKWPHRDLGSFLDGDGSSVDQPVNYVAELEDCWVELGFGTRKNNYKPSKVDWVFQGPNTVETISPDGTITKITTGTTFLQSSEHTIDTDVIITKTLHVMGDVVFDKKLNVKGDTTLDSKLNVGGVTNAQGAVNALAGTFSSTYAGVGGGAASFAVDMGINGVVTINGVVINTHTHLDAEGRPTQGPQ